MIKRKKIKMKNQTRQIIPFLLMKLVKQLDSEEFLIIKKLCKDFSELTPKWSILAEVTPPLSLSS